MTAEKNLGPNQQRWLRAHEFMTKTYPSHTVPDVPDEATLAKLSNCTVSSYNTNCFREGGCISSDEARCIFRNK